MNILRGTAGEELLIKLLSGRGREAPVEMYVIAAALIGYFAMRAVV